MPVNRPVKLSIALVLGAAAITMTAQTGNQALAARLGVQPANAAADSHGVPNAVPPLLRLMRPSELAEIGRGEARVGQEFSYRLPANARYSKAEMNVFAAEGYGRS